MLEFENGEKSCVKYINTKRPWSDARQFCEEKGSSLLYIQNENDQSVINNYLKEKADKNKEYVGAWLDISDTNSRDPTNPKMEWFHYGPASYQNWVFGEPDATQEKR